MSESSVDEDGFAWVGTGMKVPRYKNRLMHWAYDGFRLDGVLYEAENFVKVKRPQEKDFMIGKILSMYHERDEKPKLQLQLHWQARRLVKKCKNKAKPREIFADLTEKGKKSGISCEHIQAKLEVFPKQKGLKKAKNRKKAYFCERSYDPITKEIEILPEPSTLQSDASDDDSDCSDIKAISPPKKKRKVVKRAKKLTPNELYQQAHAQLQLCAVPEKLPCREREHKQIKDFIRGSIQKGGTGSGLYISGMPGTGKTATLRQIKRELKELEKNKRLNPFRFIEVNAMKLPTPPHVYTEIYRALTGESCSPRAAFKRLEKILTQDTKSRKVTVLLLDELDYLLTRNENVIYTLFDWPSRQHSKMVCIGIANTMDLIERLSARVQSRLGLMRIKFAPYQRQDINTIVLERLKKLGNVFDPDAIQFCAAKVSAVSGDVRRALQICRRAAKITETQFNALKKKPKEPMLIGIQEIGKACQSLFSSSDVIFLSNLQLYPKLFVTALLHYASGNNCDSAPLGEVLRRMNSFATTKGHRVLGYHQMEMIVEQLSRMRLIVKKYKVAERILEVRLNVKGEDVVHALHGDTDVSAILNTLRI